MKEGIARHLAQQLLWHESAAVARRTRPKRDVCVTAPLTWQGCQPVLNMRAIRQQLRISHATFAANALPLTATMPCCPDSAVEAALVL